jgi:hypothetical protein
VRCISLLVLGVVQSCYDQVEQLKPPAQPGG